ncbi:DEAD-domain-containing protein [Mytilinidion resinicola]|uniref:ATP-dependent RNA helicase n=1 Tax=Mytilinidion resinicola TaxID=574789 RepID=A0A6A6YQ64_9PEZI|nr:DEAD-domain-containing protein [Mytilinidion resinicola]KAF2811032.1 DEAD-domain-containing protein [Mytilinidion resinicola]
MSEAVYSTETLKEAHAQPYRSLEGKVNPSFLKALDKMGYEYMTPVQHKVLTALPSYSSDCLVQAKTGTGKTIAFLLPALHALLEKKTVPKGQVGILVISPTRELALQIAKECDEITACLPTPIQCHTAFGGTARASNLKKFLNGNPTVLVATPGRLNDYLGEEEVRHKFQNIRTVILDEADTMLEAGFLQDIKKVLRQLPPKKNGWQGMCFSATVPDKVKDVISVVLNPGYTHLTTIDKSEPPTVDRVPQFSIIVPAAKDVFNALYALVKLEHAQNPKDFKTIIFGTTANGVALLAAMFEVAMPELKIYQLHSRLTQNVRTRTTNDFKAASAGLMFASDVIGRGMDFPNVGLVIQLGLPASGEQYVHRVGRTARAGNEGRAIIILTQNESYFTNTNRQLPIKPYTTDLTPSIASAAPVVERAFVSVDESVKGKAYQAWLGFHKTLMKNLRMDVGGLVQTANDYAEAMGCPEPPMVDKKVVGKMGLKGVRGLNVGTVTRDAPPGGGQRGGRPAANGRGGGGIGGGPRRGARAGETDPRPQFGSSEGGNGGNGRGRGGARGGARGGPKRRGGAGGVDLDGRVSKRPNAL